MKKILIGLLALGCASTAFSQDGKSYGYTLVNKETKEQIKLICNDQSQIQDCNNFELVNSANGFQIPLLQHGELTRKTIKEAYVDSFTKEEFNLLASELDSYYIMVSAVTLSGRICRMNQNSGERDKVESCNKMSPSSFKSFKALLPEIFRLNVSNNAMYATSEVAWKQVDIYRYLRSLTRKGIKEKIVANDLAYKVLNKDRRVGYMNKTEEVSSKDYDLVAEKLKTAFIK